MDVNLAIDKLVGAGGDLVLGLDRYKTATNEKVTEYDLLEAITAADAETTNNLMSRYRILMIIKTFSLIQETDMELRSKLQDLRPSELARTHASLVQTFGVLTNPVTKVTFDFEGEVKKLAAELELPVDDVVADVKSMMAKK